jgi:hypothetical protein
MREDDICGEGIGKVGQSLIVKLMGAGYRVYGMRMMRNTQMRY